MVEKTKMNYKCYWCQFEFTKMVGRFEGSEGEKGRSNVSSQVKCSKCGNFIKTLP